MTLTDLSPVLADINRSYKRPALVAGVTDRRRLWAVGATGVRRLGDPTPVTTSDPFHIGSVAKGMTANVISLLVERGLLAWTTTAGEILPGASAMHPQMRGATVASLVSHRSGLAGYSASAADWEPFAGWSGTPFERRERFAAYVLASAPAVRPGEGLYSNAAYTVLAAMAERVADRPWEDLLRSTVLAPLGMDSAGFGWPVHAMPEAPIGHLETGDGFEVAEDELTTPPNPLLAPAGDMYLTVTDLATFARADLNSLAGERTPVGSVPAIYHGIGHPPPVEEESSIAGSAGTFYALQVLRPARQQAIVLMTNAGDGGALMHGPVLQALTEHLTRLSRN
ncbi:serine hydrolase domain-containing protein [Actinoplanes regularis]|uniref:serine hydrolase domain-containing protein n=1 Tax=Actinoplanes regularis TaxID=52697 RepID=UPI0024A2BAF5|nr:serine hydrolase domain-containing protein [Actinoplanes regularis]GLW29411.1 serine hydrolase [Actinoplanes regularis]